MKWDHLTFLVLVKWITYLQQKQLELLEHLLNLSHKDKNWKTWSCYSEVNSSFIPWICFTKSSFRTQQWWQLISISVSVHLLMCHGNTLVKMNYKALNKIRYTLMVPGNLMKNRFHSWIDMGFYIVMLQSCEHLHQILLMVPVILIT